jgi:hypothetical protein
LKGLVLQLDPHPIARQRKGRHIKRKKAEAIDDSRSAGLISVHVIHAKALPPEGPLSLARSRFMTSQLVNAWKLLMLGSLMVSFVLIAD